MISHLKSTRIPDIDLLRPAPGPVQPRSWGGKDPDELQDQGRGGPLRRRGARLDRLRRQWRSGSSADGISVVGYSVLEAANKPVFEDFEKTDEGAASRSRRRTAPRRPEPRGREQPDADVVHFSLEPDITRLVDEGLVAEGLEGQRHQGHRDLLGRGFRGPQGQPEDIQTWDDIVEPGVEIITPNPGSSGSARWNILAGWAHVTGGGSEAERKVPHQAAEQHHRPPGSGRDATTAFTEGNGDVLLSYENEAILAKQNGADVDYVVPRTPCSSRTPPPSRRTPVTTAKDFLASPARRPTTPSRASGRSSTVWSREVEAPTTRPTRSPPREAVHHRRRLRRLGRGHASSSPTARTAAHRHRWLQQDTGKVGEE